MKYLGAYLLATLGGNESPSAKDILKILGAGGLDCDMEGANKVVDALAGKSITELVEERKKKLSSVPSGGSAAPAAAGDRLEETNKTQAAELKLCHRRIESLQAALNEGLGDEESEDESDGERAMEDGRSTG
ncbi:hypothetical protein Aduo_012972 [Ancylostoma duodenale]